MFARMRDVAAPRVDRGDVIARRRIVGADSNAAGVGLDAVLGSLSVSGSAQIRNARTRLLDLPASLRAGELRRGASEFVAANGQFIDKTLFMMPIGGGVKYYWKNWLALRLSVVDNWAIGQGPLNTMHNLSVTGDVEIHFGGRRLSYFPYHGSVHLW